MTAIAEGEDSFEAFYAANAARLAGQLYFVAGGADEAGDCVQEAFARAWSHWPRLSRPGVDPIGWVYTTAYRIAISRWRRRQSQRRAVARLGPPGTSAPPSADAIAVRDALARLPQAQRAALVLHYYEGMRVEEISTVLGISVSGVKSRLARGRAALEPLVADQEESHTDRWEARP